MTESGVDGEPNHCISRGVSNISNSGISNWKIFFVKSSDAGKSFGIPIKLSNSLGASSGPEIDIRDTYDGMK
jgi:hypothetical protein